MKNAQKCQNFQNVRISSEGIIFTIPLTEFEILTYLTDPQLFIGLEDLQKVFKNLRVERAMIF